MPKLPVYKSGKRIAWTKVDKEDYLRLKDYLWLFAARGRVVTTGVHKIYPTHLSHMVLKPKRGFVIDHINHDLLDNRRRNLRHLTNADNVRHRKGPPKNNTSGVLGVSYQKSAKLWRARIAVNKVEYCRWATTKHAAIAYRKELEKIHMP